MTNKRKNMSFNNKLIMVFIAIALGNLLYLTTAGGNIDRFIELSLFQTIPLVYLWLIDKFFSKTKNFAAEKVA